MDTPCLQPSECVVMENTCCGVCGVPSLGDVEGVHTLDVDRYRDALCAEPVECELCGELPGNPNLVATCNAAACQAVDLHLLPATTCASDDQCVLRTNTCCECGTTPDASNLIAVRADGIPDVLALLCDDDAICDDCAPTYPDSLEAFCNDAGQCDVRSL